MMTSRLAKSAVGKSRDLPDNAAAPSGAIGDSQAVLP
jgi:hypothetical protein